MRAMLLSVGLALVSFLTASATVQAAGPATADEKNGLYWFLLHETALAEELKLTPEQRVDLRNLTDKLDLEYLPLRNKTALEAYSGLAKLTDEARSKVKEILDPSQEERLTQLLLWRMGPAAVISEEVSARLRYSEAQRNRLETVITESQAAMSAIAEEVGKGKPQEDVAEKVRDIQLAEQRKFNEILKPDQRTALKEVLGKQVATEKFGKPSFKAPELVDTGEWINSSPISLADQRGKVVVIHFYACGCINCIHNYPWYRQWSDTFGKDDVTIIGIHTPETDDERRVGEVRHKAEEEKFTFPIVIDGKNENWNAWGNSMWPTVYVIDKHGYLRYYWTGELKWEGKDGEKFLREHIQELIAER